MVFRNLRIVGFLMVILYQIFFVFSLNVKDSRSWTKLHETQSGVMLELGSLYFH